MAMVGQRHAPTALPPGKRHATYCTERWVDPTVGLEGRGKSRLYEESTPDRTASGQSLHLLSYPGPLH